jgi:hypothetical protein
LRDFEQGVDKIDFTKFEIAVHFAGAATSFSGAVGEMIYESHTGPGGFGATFLNIDADGDKDSDFMLSFEGAYNLTAADFLGLA